MITIEEREGETREKYLLRVAAAYIRQYCPGEEIVYDDSHCDGECLAQDCEDAAEESTNHHNHHP
jgi:hypothetical protein